jgi:hypothetical protein
MAMIAEPAPHANNIMNVVMGLPDAPSMADDCELPAVWTLPGQPLTVVFDLAFGD